MPGRVVLVFVLLLSVPPTGAAEDEYSERVVVTASRTPVPQDETGNSVTVIEREDVEQRPSAFLGDLLRGTPGVSVSRSGSFGSLTQLRLRGAEANQVLVLVDGIAVNDVFAGDEIPAELLTTFDSERIEIVRGPQSGLWGGDALAGSISITTPGAAAGSQVAVEAGSFGTIRGGVRHAFDRDALRLSVSGSYIGSDGTNVSRVGAEDDGARNVTAGASLDWRPDDRPLSIEVTARHTDVDADTDGVDFVTTGLPADAKLSTETRLSLFGATARWLPHGRWAHRMHGAFVTSDTASFAAGAATDSTGIDKLALSAQSTIELGSQRMTFALDHETRDFTQRGGATPFGDPNQDRSMDASGVVVEYRVALSRWATTAAVRHDRNSDFDDATTYRVTASFNASEATRLRLAAGSGQKTPTFIERFGFYSDQFAGNPALRPEQSTEWEIGVDQRITKRSSIELTYFDGRLRDEINGFVPGPGVFTARNEAGSSRRQGAELALASAIGDHVQFHGAYTFTDATEPAAAGDASEPRRPRHSGAIRVSYRPQRVPFDLLLKVVRTGSQLDTWFPPFPQSPQRLRLDAYVLADLTARYRVGRRIELIGRVENAFDDEYEDVFGFATPGRGVYLGLSYSTSPSR